MLCRRPLPPAFRVPAIRVRADARVLARAAGGLTGRPRRSGPWRASGWASLVLPVAVGLSLLAAAGDSAAAMDVVRDGQPVACIVVRASQADAAASGRAAKPHGGSQSADQRAAGVLVDWVKKMTGAELAVTDTPPSGTPAIFVGAVAVQAGLRLDEIDSPSHEGVRVVCDGRRVLLGGQNDTATIKAACRLLEHWGCRYYLDHPLGEVFPVCQTLTLEKLDLQEQPGFVYRHIWGSQWSGETLWKIWNGHGGLPLNTGHAWGNYVSRDLFAQHPEYFRQRNGAREPSDWYCTSNPELRRVFAQGVAARIEAGVQHPSLSPPDGRGYCECDRCRAQDDPHSREPSSGHVCITNRYVDFYQDIARQVQATHPDSILNFYCYADYTQAPTSEIRLAPNLCAWIAPIRYCRYHRIGDPACPSRWQLQELLDDWAACAQKIGYRTYNYNLAECCVPLSLLSVWKHDIPFLQDKGCIGINLETLANWQIYGPHIYLSIRLAYDPQADADAIMDEYFARLYGSQAGPLLQQYWTEIDQACVRLRTHAGSFYALHQIYTPELLRCLTDLLERATAATNGDPTLAARVAFAAEGLENARQYIALREAMNQGDFAEAQRVYDALLARSEANRSQGQGNHYTVAYLQRFVGTHVAAGAAATRAPARLVQRLPDEWRLAYDEADAGLERGYHLPDFDDWSWTPVATFSDPLDAQGIADRQTVMWYRVAIDVPSPGRRPALFFTEVDGDARVWINGREAGGSTKKRLPFTVDAAGMLKAGRNTIAVRVDHSSMTELFLGGILRPVLLVER